VKQFMRSNLGSGDLGWAQLSDGDLVSCIPIAKQPAVTDSATPIQVLMIPSHAALLAVALQEFSRSAARMHQHTYSL
jgi:hypothetical protein